MLQNFYSVSDHFGTLYIKGLLLLLISYNTNWSSFQNTQSVWSIEYQYLWRRISQILSKAWCLVGEGDGAWGVNDLPKHGFMYYYKYHYYELKSIPNM